MILQSEISDVRMLTSIVSKIVAKMFLRVSISSQKRSLTKQGKNRIERAQTALRPRSVLTSSASPPYTPTTTTATATATWSSYRNKARSENEHVIVLEFDDCPTL